MKTGTELTDGSEYFSTLIRHSPNAMLILSRQGRIRYQSPAVFRILGHKDNLNAGQRMLSFIHPEDRRAAVDYFFSVLKKEEKNTNPAEFRMRHKKGSWIWVQAIAELIGEGPAAGDVFLSFRNSNTEKITSTYIRDLNQLLQQRAAELAESNAELERFAYLTSHDLQEPLRMVTGFLQLLNKKYGSQLDSDAQQYIRFAVEGSDRMKKMIGDLLEYSRLGSNNEEMVPVDLNIVVSELSELYRDKLNQTGGKIEAGHLPIVPGKKLQLAQVFQNLIGNAIKYRSKEPPLIRIDSSLAENNMWKIMISDNGIGIDQKFADKIFVVFQRLHSQSEYPGTGIGLSICKKIAERHGGSIRLEPHEGKGSVFALFLPAT